ncbi:serine hydrolase [Aquiflexum sp.]|uniref:serine hydrolase n=1 Tax=Aquiflexum sp. TaxID=1872584 RepID=UPI0035938E4D
MKNIIVILLALIVAIPYVYSQETTGLRIKLESLLATEKGDFAIAFKDLQKPERNIFINEHENFHAASTMKIPVMLEIFKQVKEGKYKLSDSLLVKNEFKSIVDGSTYSMDISRDSGEQLYEQIGSYRSIEDLVGDMIIYSSNLATNIVIELVGADNVNSTLRGMGAKNIKVLRGVEDIKAFDAGLSNTTTAYDLMLILEAIARGEAVNTISSKRMVNILLKQKHRDMIPALLPEHVKIANKTGWINGVHHDSAIVYLPGGRKYVLVILSKNLENMDTATNMLSRASLLIYNYMESQE